MPVTRAPLALLAAAAVAAGCGGGADATTTTTPARPADPLRPAGPARSAPASHDWPLFGRTPDRAGASPAGQGLRAHTIGRLRRIGLTIPGTVDSSPIYLHDVRVRGARRDVFVVTTTYGRTLALDARDGRVLWTFTPRRIGSWQGTAQITNASPAADPGRRFVFTASPDGRVHRLSLAAGRESAGRWPVRVTRDPTHEKLTSSLNVAGRLLIVTTGGYIGDAPPYQGHVVTIDRAGGRIRGVFNSLCSDRHAIIDPRACASTHSAIWARSGAVVEPRTRTLLVATGNGPFDGRRDWGDSVLRLSPDARRLLGHWTPPNQRELEASDTDVGSTGPVLAGGLVLQSGKDAPIHVLTRRLRQVQELPAPGGAAMFSAPAVWHHGGRLHPLWRHATAGTSPVVAGGLLLVQDPGGGLVVDRAASGRELARLPTRPGHWQSPVPGGGRILVAEGDANEHRAGGTLSLFVP